MPETKYNQACINPDCHSSRGRAIYPAGDSYCFSCDTAFDADGNIMRKGAPKLTPQNHQNINTVALETIQSFDIRGFVERGIKKEVSKFFDVRVTYNTEGQIDAHYYPFPEGYIERKLPKNFRWIGKSGGLFGQHKFSPGGKRIIICEGAIDCMTMAQCSLERWDKIYPVVALSSSSATKDLLKEREYLRSFQEVVLAFDNDEAGQKATQEAARIIGYDRVKVMTMDEDGDLNDLYLKGQAGAVLSRLFESQPYIPVGIISVDDLWDEMVELHNKVSLPYPNCIDSLNKKIKGMRDHEITMFISGTGAGKSTLLREIMLYVHQETEEKIGVIVLEETPSETSRKLSAMVLERNPAEYELTLDELKTPFDQLYRGGRIISYNKPAEIDMETIIDKIEYMALAGCTKIFIDHITILVSEMNDGNSSENIAQDRTMSALLKIVKRYPVWVGLISHLRKVPSGKKAFEEGEMPTLDDIKGSGSLKQIPMDIIGFTRDTTAEDPLDRNTIRIRVLKCRHTGLTGDVAPTFYDYPSGRLRHIQDAEFLIKQQETNDEEKTQEPQAGDGPPQPKAMPIPNTRN